RPLRVRCECRSVVRRVPRHRRPSLQAAQGRAGLRQLACEPHVAGDELPRQSAVAAFAATALHGDVRPRRRMPRPQCFCAHISWLAFEIKGMGMLKIFAAALFSLVAVIDSAGAAEWPTRPVTMIVPFSAGGPLDAVARLVAPRIGAELKQPVIIENVTGAG